MITAVQTMPDGKVTFRFGADVFPVTKREALHLASEALSAVGEAPFAEPDGPGGVLISWRPGAYQPLSREDAEKLFFELEDALWGDEAA